MPSGMKFGVEPAEWPTDTPAHRANIVFRLPTTGELIELSLTAPELRSLARAALMGLGYTKTVRPWHGKQTGWENRVLASVTPAMKMIEGIFPKKPVSNAYVAGQLDPAFG